MLITNNLYVYLNKKIILLGKDIANYIQKVTK